MSAPLSASNKICPTILNLNSQQGLPLQGDYPVTTRVLESESLALNGTVTASVTSCPDNCRQVPNCPMLSGKTNLLDPTMRICSGQ